MIKKITVSVLTIVILGAAFVIYENRPSNFKVDSNMTSNGVTKNSADENLNALRDKIRPTCTPESSNFRCEYVSQGIMFDPNNPPPKVCGCRPAFCPNGQHIIVGTAQGTWPDGSQKGTFGCVSEDVP